MRLFGRFDMLTNERVSRIAVMEPGMFGVMEPVSGC
jgi:hypothetical protein